MKSVETDIDLVSGLKFIYRLEKSFAPGVKSTAKHTEHIQPE
jgi:hypothetical protein